VTFNSVEFALLLALVLVVHWGVRPSWRNGVVLVASAVFYGWFDPRFLALLATSTLIDFAVARAIARRSDPRRRRQLLAVSVTTNLAILALFKYAGFFVGSATRALEALGLGANPVLLEIALPVGISFYTFQTISYTVDVHRRRIEPAPDLLTFATFVAWFPQLVAGPIERAERLLPRIADTARTFPRGAELQRAVGLVVLGLAQKVVLADGVAPIVNRAFEDAAGASWLALLAGAVGFSIQIYGDFAGYSSIARGVSLLLGVELMANFREPYLSRSPTEFWRRWHISLSTWLRDYLYIPLGGNRGGRSATMRNLMATMLLGGLWHGAGWTFVLWGGLHGLYLAVHRLLGERPRPARLRPSDLPAVLGTFALVTATWIPFRADDLGQAAAVAGGLLTARTGTWSPVDAATVAVLAALTAALDLALRAQDLRGPVPLVRSPAAAGAALAGLLLGVVVFSGGTPEPFIYFRF
jgi:alginate O-acetyltransferase complex protein AlgI